MILPILSGNHERTQDNCAVCLAQDMQISINIKPQRRTRDRNREFKPYDYMQLTIFNSCKH